MSPPEPDSSPSFKIDENLPESAAERLRLAGYDCASIWGQGYSGSDDPTVSKVCASEGRVLVTLDRGFGNIQAYPPSTHPGIIILALSNPGARGIAALIDQLILLLDGGERVDGCLWILEHGRLRVRGSESAG